MKLILEWLEDGKIPVMATTPGEICHYIHQEEYGQPLEWVQGRANRRFAVQLFEERLDRFLKFLAKNPPADDVLYLPIRSSFEVDGLDGIHLVIGAARSHGRSRSLSQDSFNPMSMSSKGTWHLFNGSAF